MRRGEGGQVDAERGAQQVAGPDPLELGAGYLAAGHEPVLIIPGTQDSDEQTPQGRVITLSGPRIPFTGGYRALLRKRRVAALLSELRPHTLEVSDRTTLRWTGRWARERGVPAVMISHESLAARTSAGTASSPASSTSC